MATSEERSVIHLSSPAMKSTSDSDSSSSDDDETMDALREATDHDFLKESLFNATQAQVSPRVEEQKDTSKLKSLRRNLDEEKNYDEFRVAPAFKKFVAQKLDKILERTIELSNEESIERPSEKEREDMFGVKLLTTSTNLLTTEEERDDTNIRIRKRRSVEIRETGDDLRRFFEAAVDPEWILSKTDTKAWVNKRKDPEFKYKKQRNGVLKAQD